MVAVGDLGSKQVLRPNSTVKTMAHALALMCCFYAMSSQSAAAEVQVKVKSGLLQGTALPNGGAVFKGVPYAAAPVGALRWRSPASVADWTNVRGAQSYGSACLQPDQGWNSSLIATASEDCLYLNVWTATLKRSARLPVMVWIHGGAFVGGSGTDPMFAGEELVKKNVVLVTLNYRLGIFGFLAHPELTRDSSHQSSGNFGLEDQLAALQWVRDNIAAFGGDPSQITLFGQSAGGMSVTTLVASALSRGHFRRAIIESGSILGGPPMKDLAGAEMMGAEFAGPEGIRPLREAGAADVMKRFNEYMSTHRDTRVGPIIDHYVLNDDPAATFRHHEEHAVPIIIGNNAREGFGRIPDEALPGILRKFYGVEAERASRLYGSGTPDPLPSDPVLGSAASQWLTDSTFRCGAVITASQHSTGGSPVYEYQFEQSIPGREADGAAHTYELPYVFGNLWSDGPLAGHFGATDRDLSNVMIAFWTNFAKRGDPNGPGLPRWPRFDHPFGSYLRLSSALPGDTSIAVSLRKAQCDLYETQISSR
jgi:para-nitrobenzyl esterase